MDFFFKNVKYHVETFGNGEPIMALHGFTGYGNSWRFYSEEISDRTIIAPDIIGHGQSDSPEDISHYQIEEQAAMLAHLIDIMKLNKVDVVGYSMGGRLAITFALLFPEKVHRLILESTTPGIDSSEDRALRIKNDMKICQMIKDKEIEGFVNYWENIPLFASQKRLTARKREQVRRQRLRNNPQGLINSLIGMGTGAQPSWWTAIAELQMPVLILTGSIDQKFCMIGEEMSKRIQHATHHTIEESGHTVHLEKPLQYVAEIEKFLLETSTC
ncbi:MULTISPECIES: 2-succinyl-6-hydroxy-2,4-cyclohexadiene-1-carboxylate synthase [Cytobacillus]|uniref:Putative 2-succinyl-6-hydroxy-2,4-cyclohexadiene-1-carboxylate synthase n=1 Tax=Cytobacillus stercorigallinarum TaxID=2762240 RepID=A0ABR8QIS8_9BACI|nr:2-succinyl-6-hydroxy-2,4-cyclohexadiene-1-carboxylate synthase [Cytobacillus stercorigallinarum]MBD7935421.1 2-succinyl-6-hydroxy-2,4-cyclohexadiene-1-carboxylate synthase [Cytobacillus stercorigallinarum]